MRRITRLLVVTALLLGQVVAGSLTHVEADVTGAPSLVISQIKITASNGQFMTLYNASDTTLDMSKYQIAYFNSFDLSKATSSRLVSLTGVVAPHSYFLISDSSQQLCYQVTVDSTSLGFSSTAGFVELLGFSQTATGGPVGIVLQDYVGWSKSAATGAQTLPTSTAASLLRQPYDGQNRPSVAGPGAGSWLAVQTDAANPCNLVSTTTPATVIQTGTSTLLPGGQPPVTIVAAAPDETAVADALPASDIGLAAPQITELLPNPAGTGNDASDEYIELYNPNGTSFDLTGFVLETGTTTTHRFTFPAATSIAPLSFVAYYSSYTGLSLSNTSGSAKLYDPNNIVISTTDVYINASDGIAWALGANKWQWTSKATPGLSNTIEVVAKKTTAKSSKTTSAAKTQTTKKLPVTAHATAAAKTVVRTSQSDNLSPIHMWVLALIIGVALLYGAYEYRTDIRNKLFQLRRYINDRRNHRLATSRR